MTNNSDANTDVNEFISLLKFLSKWKIVLIGFNLAVIVFSFYTYQTQNTQNDKVDNVFKGDFFIELGLRNNRQSFDNSQDLIHVMKKKFDINLQEVNGKRVLRVFSQDMNRNALEKRLIDSKNYILSRHRRLTQDEQDVIPTEVLGEIEISLISRKISKPTISLIKSLASGFLLSVLLVSLLDFLFRVRKEWKKA